MQLDLVKYTAWGAPEALVPDGWKLVPRQPTREMIEAGERSWRYGGGSDENSYLAMLSAAPQFAVEGYASREPYAYHWHFSCPFGAPGQTGDMLIFSAEEELLEMARRGGHSSKRTISVTPLFTTPTQQPEIDKEEPDSDWRLKGYSYASKQATKCASCGEHKHTPLRIDAMDGYVCLTCIDKKLGGLLGEFGYPDDEICDFIEGMTVSIDISTGEHDAGARLFGTVGEVMRHQNGDKHGLVLLVQNPESNS